MIEKEKLEDSIHLRAIKYGRQYPNGFMYADIEHHYSRRREEWQIVKKFLHDAWNNYDQGISQITPFVLLEKMGNLSADNSKYTLSYEAYFNYLDYEELQQARYNAREAQRSSTIAICIAIMSMIISGALSLWQINNPVSLDQDQYQAFMRSIHDNQRGYCHFR